MVEHIFVSPQVKQSVIISNKLLYSSCFTSAKQLRILGKKISGRPQNFIELLPTALCHMKT